MDGWTDGWMNLNGKLTPLYPTTQAARQAETALAQREQEYQDLEGEMREMQTRHGGVVAERDAAMARNKALAATVVKKSKEVDDLDKRREELEGWVLGGLRERERERAMKWRAAQATSS